jgi:hypothetical protein
MKIVLSLLFVMALSVAVLAQSQDQSSGQGQSGSQGSQGQASQGQSSQSQGGQMQGNNPSNGAQNMTGTVGHTGKDFTNDKNSQKYKVDNPEALKGREDQHVALLVQVDPDNNVIHVVQLEPPQ